MIEKICFIYIWIVAVACLVHKEAFYNIKTGFAMIMFGSYIRLASNKIEE